MSEIDFEALEAIRAWAQKRIDHDEHRQRMAPLFDAMQKNMKAMQENMIPNLMVGPEARFRESVLALENSQQEFPQCLAEAETEYVLIMSSLRRRTEALRHLLEAVS